MILKRLTIKGFKNFKEEVEIQFDRELTHIQGHNAKGKSTIYDAIMWVFTGYTKDGSKQISELCNTASSDTEVSVQFEENGREYVLLRGMKKTGTRTLKLNGTVTTQKKIEEIIDSQTFLMTVNPLYYFSFQPQEARTELLNQLPIVKKEDVMNQLPKKVVKAIESLPLEQPYQDLQTKKRLELKNLEQMGYEKVINTLKRGKKVLPESIPFTKEEEEKIVELQRKEIEFLKKQPKLKDVSSYAVEKRELELKKEQLEKQQYDRTNRLQLVSSLKIERTKLQMEQGKQFEEIKDEKLGTVATIHEKIGYMRVSLAEKKKSKESIEGKRKSLLASKKLFHENDHCPYCSSLLQVDTSHFLNEKLANDIIQKEKELIEKEETYEKEIEQAIQEGNAIIECFKKLKAENSEQFEKFEAEKKVRMEKILASIKELEKSIKEDEEAERVYNEKKKADLESLQKEIDTQPFTLIEKENEQARLSFEKRREVALKNLRKELHELQLKKKAHEDREKERSIITQHNNHVDTEIIKNQTLQKELEEKMKMISDQIDGLKQFYLMQIKLTTDILKQYLNHVEISLVRTKKDGDTYDVFDVLYDGKQLTMCSTSEQIRAGLEITHMFSCLKSVHYPVIIDNAEGICEYDTHGCQTIELCVVRNSPLTIVAGENKTIINGDSPLETKSVRSGIFDIIAS